jgi:hypothetical protein
VLALCGCVAIPLVRRRGVAEPAGSEAGVGVEVGVGPA